MGNWLHGELGAAYDEVVSRFADRFPDPRPDVGIITELKAQLRQLEQGQLATAHGELHRLTKTTWRPEGLVGDLHLTSRAIAMPTWPTSLGRDSQCISDALRV